MSIKKNIGFLMGGTALAQIFTFAISPILTRIYNPESFGVLGTILAASSIIAIFANLRLNLAIAKSKNLNEAKLILKISIFSSVFFSFLLSIFLILSNFIFENNYTLIIVIFIFFISLLNSLIDVFNYWQSYRGKHFLSAKNSVFRSLLTGLTQIFIGFFSNFGLVIGVFLGALGSLILFLKEYVKSDKNKGYTKFNFQKTRFILIKYKDFPLYSMPQGFIASVSLNSVPLILGYYFGMSIAGQYWLSYRILLAPIALVGGAYRQVLHPIYSDIMVSTAKKINLAKKHTFIGLSIFTPIILVVFLYSELLFKYLFGLDWIVAGKFTGWLVLCFGLDIVKVPAICLINACGQNKLFLFFEILLGFGRVFIVLVFSIYFDFLIAIQAFSILSAIASIVLIYLCLFKWFKNN